jgi:hypothetical protein
MIRALRVAAATALVLAIVAVSGSAGAAAAEHPGCKGIDQASSKASVKGKAALAVVSEKFGCGTVVPDVTDPVACAAGSVSLGRATYLGGPTDVIDPYGYAVWDGAWTNSGENSSAGVVLNASADGRGFYFYESATTPVTSIVARSLTGEVITITDFSSPGDPTWSLDPSRAVSHNWFVTRTGFNLVNFCGAAA